MRYTLQWFFVIHRLRCLLNVGHIVIRAPLLLPLAMLAVRLLRKAVNAATVRAGAAIRSLYHQRGQGVTNSLKGILAVVPNTAVERRLGSGNLLLFSHLSPRSLLRYPACSSPRRHRISCVEGSGFVAALGSRH